MANRPTRTRITNELGNPQTLPDDIGQFEVMPGGPGTIFLGLGPRPGNLLKLFPDIKVARFVESPDMERQTDQWDNTVPAGFTRMEPDEFSAEIAAKSTIIRYRPNLKAFPTFWGPLVGRTALGKIPPAIKSKTVWLPLGEDDLLGKELTLAFKAKGYEVRSVDREILERSPGTELPELLRQETPELFFSVNFKGLDPFGLGYNILREAGVKVAIWLVDNPFNLLTSVKSGYWKDAKLFVTDHSLISPLIETGAKWVTHLPLAACPELFGKGGKLPAHAHGIEDKLVFVGRSKFPKKDNFFAGLTVPTDQLDLIHDDAKNTRFDFFWWRDQLNISPLWPGNKVREIGMGAEFAGQSWKKKALETAGPIVLFGDGGWKGIGQADLRSVVDYYAHLPAVYRTASICLNISGMQLPAGLTQRHFDVWCAGGFLITDANPGLKIFQDELTGPISFSNPGEIPELFTRFQQETDEKSDLCKAGQELSLRDHTYHNRATTVLKTLGL